MFDQIDNLWHFYFKKMQFQFNIIPVNTRETFEIT